MTTAINYRLCVIYFPKLDERNYGSYRFEISSKITPIIRSTRSENGESKMLEEENETEWTIISRLKEEEAFSFQLGERLMLQHRIAVPDPA